MAVWACCHGVFSRVLAALGQRNAMMDLKVRGPVARASEWRSVLANLANTPRALEHFRDYIRVPLEHEHDLRHSPRDADRSLKSLLPGGGIPPQLTDFLVKGILTRSCALRRHIRDADPWNVLGR